MNLRKRKNQASFVIDTKILKKLKLLKPLSMPTLKHGKNFSKISSKINLNIYPKDFIKS